MQAAALTFQAHTPSGAVQAPAAGAAPLHTVTWPLPHQVHGSFARAGLAVARVTSISTFYTKWYLLLEGTPSSTLLGAGGSICRRTE